MAKTQRCVNTAAIFIPTIWLSQLSQRILKRRIHPKFGTKVQPSSFLISNPRSEVREYVAVNANHPSTPLSYLQ